MKKIIITVLAALFVGFIAFAVHSLSRPSTLLYYASMRGNEKNFDRAVLSNALKQNPGDIKIIVKLPGPTPVKYNNGSYATINGLNFYFDYPAIKILKDKKNNIIEILPADTTAKESAAGEALPGTASLKSPLIYFTGDDSSLSKINSSKETASSKNPVFIVPYNYGIKSLLNYENPANKIQQAPFADSRRSAMLYRITPPSFMGSWKAGGENINLQKGASVSSRGKAGKDDIPIEDKIYPLGWGDKDLTNPLPPEKKSNAALFLADLISQDTGARFGIINYMALRGDLTGPVTPDDIRRLLPFDNKIVILEMPGKYIKEIYGSNPERLAFSGINDPGLNLIKDEEFYNVGTIDYLASGGRGTHPLFLKSRKRIDTGLYLNDLLSDRLIKDRFIFTPGKYSPAEIEKFYSSGKSLENPGTLCIAGIKMLESGNKEEAGRLFKKASKLDPDNIRLKKIAGIIPDPAVVGPPYPAQSLSGQWPRFRGDAQGTGLAKTRGPGTLNLISMTKTGFEIMSSPAIAEDGTVIAGSGDFHLYAFTPEGKIKWKFKTGEPVLSSPALTKDSIYFGSNDGWFYCLDYHGKMRWACPARGRIISSPNITKEGLVVFGSQDGDIRAMTRDGHPAWICEIGGFVFSSPSLDKEGNIYAGSGDGNFYCINSGGKIQWKYETGKEIYSSPLIDDEGNIYFGSDNGVFYSLDRSGKLLWSYKTKGAVPGSAALTPSGNILMPSEDNNLYCIDKGGRVIWTCDLESEVFSSPAVDSDGKAYLGSEENNIYCISPEGKILWKYKAGGYVNSSPALSISGHLYIGSNDGCLYHFGKE
ncbi:MAG: PQQ-binding-like beta-propeller repeat protein [Chloroflexi bacterium]|nr:PQQ-binding-like beta-propeller repeat protein [Chloroflexota bacterium]